MRSTLTRLVAVVGLAVAQLRRSPGRTGLVVVAIALAVLAVTLLSGLGLGVVATGEEQFAAADQDVWVTADGVELTDRGTVSNPITDSHRLATALEDREDVDSASPLAFHAVYVGTDPDDRELVTAVGVTGSENGSVSAGQGFSEANPHYADGAYNGTRTNETIVAPETADRFDLEPGDTLYVDSSHDGTAETELTVVGISSRYADFLGTPTVTIPLSELQQLAGTTGADRATFVTLSVADDADPDAVAADVQDDYPEYDVQTSDDQLTSVLEERVLVIASGIALVALAVVAGIALTVNVLAVVAAQQRDALAALHAVGLSRGLIAGVIGSQGLVLGVLGGAVGLAVTPLAARGLDQLAMAVVGFDGLLRTHQAVYAVGGVIAIGVGTFAAVVVGWRVSRYARVERLES